MSKTTYTTPWKGIAYSGHSIIVAEYVRDELTKMMENKTPFPLALSGGGQLIINQVVTDEDGAEMIYKVAFRGVYTVDVDDPRFL